MDGRKGRGARRVEGASDLTRLFRRVDRVHQGRSSEIRARLTHPGAGGAGGAGSGSPCTKERGPFLSAFPIRLHSAVVLAHSFVNRELAGWRAPSLPLYHHACVVLGYAAQHTTHTIPNHMLMHKRESE